MKTTSCHFPVTSGRLAAESPPCQPRQARRSIGTQVGRGAITAPLAEQRVSRSGLVFLALIVALVTVPVRLASAAEGVNELLQKGLFEEEANHNLDAAIKAYQSVITQQDDQRKLAATAVFRLGECYRKLGRTNEATAQYERILSDFADQPSLAALSRQYLGHTTSEQSAPSRGSNDAQATQRKLIELRAEYDQARTLNATLKGMPRIQQKQVIPTVAPDPLLEKLMAQLATAEQKVAELSDSFGPDHPDMRTATRIVKTIQGQIEDRLDAILAGLSLREAAAKSALDDFTQESKKSREEASPQSATAGATDAEEKELREIKAIIKDSPDLINVTGIAPYGTRLLNAAATGHVQVAEFLLANKADVNARTSMGYASPGDSALHLAADFGHKTMVELLLRQGAEVNAVERGGGTPLHHAACNGFRTIAEVLLANGADVNANGSALIISRHLQMAGTPLHAAAYTGAASLVELLVAKGAEVNVTTIGPSATLLRWAEEKLVSGVEGGLSREQQRTLAEIVDLLRKAGATSK